MEHFSQVQVLPHLLLIESIEMILLLLNAYCYQERAKSLHQIQILTMVVVAAADVEACEHLQELPVVVS